MLFVISVVVVGVVLAAAVSVSSLRERRARLVAYEAISRKRAASAAHEGVRRADTAASQIEAGRAYLRTAHERSENAARPLGAALAAQYAAANARQADSDARVRSYLEHVHDMLGTKTASLRADVEAIGREQVADVAMRMGPYESMAEFKSSMGMGDDGAYRLRDFRIQGASSELPSTLVALASVADEYVRRQEDLRIADSLVSAGISAAVMQSRGQRDELGRRAGLADRAIRALDQSGFESDVERLRLSIAAEIRVAAREADDHATAALASVLSVAGDPVRYRIAPGADNEAHLESWFADATRSFRQTRVDATYASAVQRYEEAVTDVAAVHASVGRALSAAMTTQLGRLLSVSAHVERVASRMAGMTLEAPDAAVYVPRDQLAAAFGNAVSSGANLDGLAARVLGSLSSEMLVYREVRDGNQQTLTGFVSAMTSVAAAYNSDFWDSVLPAPGVVHVTELSTASGGITRQDVTVARGYGPEYRMRLPPRARFDSIYVQGAGGQTHLVPMAAFASAWGDLQTEAELSVAVQGLAARGHAHGEYVPAATLLTVRSQAADEMRAQLAQPVALGSGVTSVHASKVRCAGTPSRAVAVRGLSEWISSNATLSASSEATFDLNRFDWTWNGANTAVFDSSQVTASNQDLAGVVQRVLSVGGVLSVHGTFTVPSDKVSIPFGGVVLSVATPVTNCAPYASVTATNIVSVSSSVCTYNAQTRSNSCLSTPSSFNDGFGNPVHASVSAGCLQLVNSSSNVVHSVSLLTGGSCFLGSPDV